MLKHLGIINESTKLAGSSGGAIIGAFTCSGVSTDTAIATMSTLSNMCRVSGDCRHTLKALEAAGLAGTFSGDAHTRCSGRLFVSITEARPNPEADVERVISTFPTRSSLIESLLASSYIPGFSSRSSVMLPTELGVAAAYDGVCSNPLPVPPGEWGEGKGVLLRSTPG